jgi:hypothetical protein
LKQFKRTLPRKKEQALRTNIQAIWERQSKKKKIHENETSQNVTVCPVVKMFVKRSLLIKVDTVLAVIYVIAGIIMAV